ncbi:unnamed protein product [Caenorhabditis angaria]|uniref:Prefoldin subunit alpha n=1 Tax=Caenorhabditis angaria TaxID=860376 RepID=A0A9P1ILY9_9PELO|nr:unnamed protein product [Caenorhabditis angaria]
MFNLSKNLDQRIEEVYRPSLLENYRILERKQQICEEYSKLIFSCEKLMAGTENGEKIEAKTEVGMKIYVNVEVRDPRHVIVNLGDDIYAKLPLEKAVEFSKSKIERLKNEMSEIQTRINGLNSQINIMLSQITVE